MIRTNVNLEKEHYEYIRMVAYKNHTTVSNLIRCLISAAQLQRIEYAESRYWKGYFGIKRGRNERKDN